MTNETITIELAGAPMAKERVRVTKEGHAYTPQRTINYEARLAHAAQMVMNGRPLLEGPLEVVVETYMAIAVSKPKAWKEWALNGLIRPTKKPDWDNFGKILDALNLIVWADDAQIVDGRVVKWYSDRPRMVISIRAVKQNEGAFA